MYYKMMEEIEAKVNSYLESLPCVSADELGLDRRCGHVYVDALAGVLIFSEESRVDYYGGFEYIPKELVQNMRGYKIYTEHERVEEAIKFYESHLDECQE